MGFVVVGDFDGQTGKACCPPGCHEHYHLVFFIRSEKKTLSMIFTFLRIYDSPLDEKISNHPLALSNPQVAKAKEADIELDMFPTYEDYLDSKLEEGQRRQDAVDRAYHRLQLLWSLDPQGPLLTDKEFNQAKEAMGPEESTIDHGSGDLSKVLLPRLERVCKEAKEDHHLLLYLHVVHDSGAEVSGHIDLTDRLTNPAFLPELRHRGVLVPVPGDLTFYNWRTSSLRFSPLLN